MNPVASASASSFSPNSGLRAHMATGVGANVYFKNPGSGASFSHFWLLQASTSSTARVRTNVFVDSLLLGEFSRANLSSDSSAQGIVRTVTTKGVYNAGTFGLALGGVAINLIDGVAASTFFNSVTWNNFPASYTGTLFTQNRSAAAGPQINFNNFSAITLTGAGKFINNIGTQTLLLGGSNTGISGTGVCVPGGPLSGGLSCP